MAPLYKRYIPPKPSVVPPSATSTTTSKIVPLPAPDEAPKKRKRDRSEAEIAERKAKKLRKKGIDPDSVLNPDQQPDSNASIVENRNGNHNEQSSQRFVNEPAGEFAHIKNAKKRHKLEKEARKARKATERAAHGAGEDEDAQAAASRGTQEESTTLGHVVGSTISHNTNGASIRRTKDNDRIGNDANEELPDLGDVQSTRTDEVVQRSKKKTKDGRREDEEPPQREFRKPNDVAEPDVQDDNTAVKPKKRRHKLEGVLRDSENSARDRENDGNGDDHLRKHENIMSKFKKSQNLSQTAPRPVVVSEENTESAPVVLDLGPLPQPEKAPSPEFVPDRSALPRWLAEPTVVPSDSPGSFASLELGPKVVQHLSKLGFEDAMPVQQALIPLLLSPGTPGARHMPGTESVLPDIAVGAPTGSGKTIAYLLPMIESLKKSAGTGRLKAIVVVPTRELVMQVAAVAESLARGSNVKIGTATGHGTFKDEQAKLVKTGRVYDPAGYKQLLLKAHWRNYPPAEDSDDYEQYLNDLENQDVRENKRVQNAVTCLVDHVPTYESSIDILVATPGRLLEHLSTTLGFSLAHLEWLVLDEADKLIDQQYQGFLEALDKELQRPRRDEEQDARERYLRTKCCWDERRERRIRKVVLSATMTRDISKLADLKLKRPKMVLVRSQQDVSNANEDTAETSLRETGGVREIGDGFELPLTLREYCVHAGDGSEKPLYLAALLAKRIFGLPEMVAMNVNEIAEEEVSSETSAVDARSNADSASDAESNLNGDGTSETGEDGEADQENNDRRGKSEDPGKVEARMHPERTAMLGDLRLRQRAVVKIPTVLVFTSSTESANRLSYLLKKLHSELAPSVYTITKESSKKNQFSKTKTSDPIIAISTDRAARGLDAIANRSITHVLQYDVPRSTVGYVHRAGRTARAGGHGEAWTLYTHSEARWFINEVSKAKTIKRVEPVERVKLQVGDQAMRETFADAIAEMRDEVQTRGLKNK